MKEREGVAMVEGKLKGNVLYREQADVSLMWQGKTHYHTLHSYKNLKLLREQMEELTSQLSEHELDERRPQDIYILKQEIGCFIGVSPRLSHNGCDGDGLGGCHGCWRWSGGGSSVACDDEVEEMKMKVVVMMMTRGCWWYDGVDRDDGDGVDMVVGERRRRGRGGSGDRRL
ncbi:hypothetical protein Tco_1061532 [Tanacetum coccineum]